MGIVDEAFGELDGAYLEITLKDGSQVDGIARIDKNAAHPLHIVINGTPFQIPLGKIRMFKDVSPASDEMP